MLGLPLIKHFKILGLFLDLFQNSVSLTDPNCDNTSDFNSTECITRKWKILFKERICSNTGQGRDKYPVRAETNTFVHKTIFPGPEVIKLFFMLNSAEHEILNAHKYEKSRSSAIFRFR